MYPVVFKEGHGLNLHDKAHELVRNIRESDAYIRAKNAKQAIEQTPSTLEMVQDFKRRQLQLQAKQMMGQTVTETDLSQLQQQSEVISLNQDARTFLQADRELQVLMMDVQKILTDVMDEVSLFSLEQMYEEMGRSE